MPDQTVHIGTQVKASITYTVAGVATDPTSVVFKIEDGAGTETAHSSLVVSLPADGITTSGTGVFHYVFTPYVAGTWTVRSFATGAVVKADSIKLKVRASVFASPLGT